RRHKKPEKWGSHKTTPGGQRRISGDRASRPREAASPRPPLAELGVGPRSCAGDREGCCVGGPWLHSRGPGGLGAARESRFPAEHTKTGIVLKIQCDVITITPTHEDYIIRM
ncbi:unnamed protein product, partial [Laminaria digitata]